MNLSAFHFSISAKELILKPLTLPKFGVLLPNAIDKFLVSHYTKMCIYLSGFVTLVDTVDESELKRILRLHNQLHISYGKILAHNLASKKKNTALIEIVQKNCAVIETTIERIEDRLNKHYNYAISVNVVDNDWNSPENDHWDNY